MFFGFSFVMWTISWLIDWRLGLVGYLLVVYFWYLRLDFLLFVVMILLWVIAFCLRCFCLNLVWCVVCIACRLFCVLYVYCLFMIGFLMFCFVDVWIAGLNVFWFVFSFCGYVVVYCLWLRVRVFVLWVYVCLLAY